MIGLLDENDATASPLVGLSLAMPAVKRQLAAQIAAIQAAHG